MNYHFNLEIFKLCLSLASEDVDLIYRKNSTHQLESPPDLELFLTTLDRYLVSRGPSMGWGCGNLLSKAALLDYKNNSFCSFLLILIPSHFVVASKNVH